MEREHIRFLTAHANFVEREPGCLLKDDSSFKKFKSDFRKIKYFRGKFAKKSKLQKCIIREFISIDSEVKQFANNEITNIEFIGRFIRISEIFCFYFETFSSELTKYVIVTRSYENSFNNYSETDENKKINLIYKLANSLEYMNQKGIFYGALRPEFIFIDDDENVVLSDFLWSNNIFLSDIDIYKPLLTVLDSSFLSPETLILKNNQNIIATKFNTVASDIFSLGLIIMHIFNFYKEVNNLHGNPQEIFDSINIQSFNYKFDKIEVEISTNGLFNECTSWFLEYKAFKRLKYQNFLELFNNSTIVRSYSKKFIEVISIFENYINTLKQTNIHSFGKYIKGTKDSYFMKASEHLEEAYNNFLSTKCRSEEINIEDGILYFIRELFHDLSNDDIGVDFMSAIRECQSSMNYKEIFLNIYNLDPVLQDYVLTGLAVQNYSKDWDYFFPGHSIYKLFEYNFKLNLRDFNVLKDEFNDFIMNPFINNKLLKYCPKSINLTRESLDNILQNVYILKIQPSIYGLTTYNGNIFISNFGLKFKSINPKVIIPEEINLEEIKLEESESEIIKPEQKVAILLTLFHELAHLLRRSDCEKFMNAKNRYTPKNNEGFIEHEERGLTENQIQVNRGEAGIELEIKIFDESLKSINRLAAEYLLSKPFEDEDFLKKLKIKNAEKANTIYMGKTSDYLAGGIKCGFSNNIGYY